MNRLPTPEPGTPSGRCPACGTPLNSASVGEDLSLPGISTGEAALCPLGRDEPRPGCLHRPCEPDEIGQTPADPSQRPCSGCTRFPDRVAELALGHTHKSVRPGVDLLEQRRAVMEQWSQYLTRPTTPD